MPLWNYLLGIRNYSFIQRYRTTKQTEQKIAVIVIKLLEQWVSSKRTIVTLIKGSIQIFNNVFLKCRFNNIFLLEKFKLLKIKDLKNHKEY